MCHQTGYLRVCSGPCLHPPSFTHTLSRVTGRAMEGPPDHLLSGFRSHSGCLQDRDWQEPSGWSAKSAAAFPDEQSQGGRGAPEPAPAGEEHHVGRCPLPGVPEGTGCPGPGTLHSLLPDPGGLRGLLLLAFFFFNRGTFFLRFSILTEC